MAEPHAIAIQHDHTVALGGLQLLHAEPERARRAQHPLEVTVGLGGRDDQCVPDRRRQAAEHEVDDPLAGRTDRQRIGEVDTAGALIGVEQIGRLDEHERDPPAGGDQLAANRRRLYAGVGEYRVGHLVRHCVQHVRRPGVGAVVGARSARRHGSRCDRTGGGARCREGAPAGGIDPRKVVHDDHDGCPLGGLHEEVPGREGDGEGFDRLFGALDGERRSQHAAARAGGRSSRPSSNPSSIPARPDHASSTSASTPTSRVMRTPGWSTAIRSQAWSRTAVLPMPGSPTTVNAPPAPRRHARRAPARASSTSSRPWSTGGRAAVFTGRRRWAVGSRGFPDAGRRHHLGRLSTWPRTTLESHAERVMGAGARLAEERDRWEDHWLMVDLDREGEHLLDLLSPTEELRAVVPGLRSAPDGEGPVLVGITDRRALVIGRRPSTGTGDGSGPSHGFGVHDVTTRVAEFVRGTPMVVADGDTIELDLGELALDRLCISIDGLGPAVGAGSASNEVSAERSASPALSSTVCRTP